MRFKDRESAHKYRMDNKKLMPVGKGHPPALPRVEKIAKDAKKAIDEEVKNAESESGKPENNNKKFLIIGGIAVVAIAGFFIWKKFKK